MIDEKLRQAAAILEEQDIDVWLTFVRESATNPDPCLDLMVGTHVTWPSAFIVSRRGDSIALVGNLDEAHLRAVTPYREVIPYLADIKEKLIEVLDRLKPARIALNYSDSDVMADGLSHGMWMLLRDILAGTPYFDRVVSSQPVVAAVRGRKSPRELACLQEAIRLTERIFELVTAFLEPGQTEREIAAFVQDHMNELELPPAWDPQMCPSVFTGPDSAGAHAGPTDRRVERGHLLNMDLGVRYRDYCSDLQRTWYIREEGESEAPPDVISGFEAVRDAIARAAAALVPGARGWELDEVARSHIQSRGFPEYPHALGHQVGRKAHDGGGILGPRWARYGDLVRFPVEKEQVYTLEPRVPVEGRGVATLEEMVVVEEGGGRFLSTPQPEPWLI